MTEYDLAIVGSGFSGSLMAMIGRRLGRSVILLERGRHPRFAIGESSTPLANLVLEQLAERYDLPAVRSLTKWGSWQRTHPEIVCGLKRGFTFYHHEFGKPFCDDHENRANELLVAASPHDEIADTHWYRPDVDHFLVEQAQSLGVEYCDETSTNLVSEDEKGTRLKITRDGRAREIHAKLLVDASGPRGFLQNALQLGERSFAGLRSAAALYAHFSGVNRWGDTHQTNFLPPYPPDDAAVHHVFDGGWIWVLRFKNGLTSAGVAATEALARELSLEDGGAAWERLLERLPSVRAIFVASKATTPFFYLPRLPFRASTAARGSWVMLPSAAGVVDPLLSTGMALTLLGIERLAEIIERKWGTETMRAELFSLGERTLSELDATARLVAALYVNLRDFEVFSALTLLYFASASFSESARRLERPDLARSFLLHDDPCFGPALAACCNEALQIKTSAQRTALLANIRSTIEPFDIAGLGKTDRRNWYPALADDFIESAHKLDVSRERAAEALTMAGFTPDSGRLIQQWH